MNEALISHLKKRYPMLEYFTDRPFGIEIEGYGLEYYLIPPDNGIVKPYNISSVARDGRRFDELLPEYDLCLGTTKNAWHIEEDSSITHRGGFELISPILSGMSGLVQVYHFLEMLGRIKGIEIDASCGFHVHHGVDEKTFTCKQLQQLVRIVHCMEDYFYLLIPGNRRENATCRPVEVDVKAFLDPLICAADPETAIERIKELWYSRENRFEADEEPKGKYDKTRYHGLNLHSYWYRSTIEFRYHSAVLHNRDEAMQWIIFTQFLVELSEGRIPEILMLPDANKWLKTIYKIYLAFGHLERMHRAAGKTREGSCP